MSKKICISEKQYKMAIEEGILPDNEKIDVSAPVEKYNNDPSQALKDTEKKIKDAGGDINRFNVTVNGNNLNAGQKFKDTKIVSDNQTDTTNKSVYNESFLTKKQLMERRLSTLKKNSRVYTLKDFISNWE